LLQLLTIRSIADRETPLRIRRSRRNFREGTSNKLILRKKSKNQPTRQPVARAALEQSLAEAVKAAHPEFETFVGVVVERVVPAVSGGPNWALKGVKYGAADRHRSSIVLLYCVEEAQLAFEISD
jgi:hypothetical protein